MTPISRSRENIFLLAIGILGLILFVYFFPRVHRSASVDLTVDRKEALQIAKTQLNEAVAPGNASEYSNVRIVFEADNKYHSFLEHINVPSEKQEIFTQHSAPGFWKVTYENPEDRSRYRFHLSTNGRVFYSDFKAPEDMPGERLPPHEAEEIAQQRLSELLDIDWSAYSRVDAQSADQETRIDHTFAWYTSTSVPGEAKLRVDATIIGDQLKSWKKSIEFPKEFSDRYEARNTAYSLSTVTQVIIALVFWMIALFVFAFRFRSDEVSIRNGLIIATTMLGASILYWGDSFYFVQEFGPEADSELGNIIKYVNIGLQIFFTSFGLFFVWTAGESVGRDLWPSKLRIIDGLFAGRLFFPSLGRSILRGFSLGLFLLGIWYLLAFLATDRQTVWGSFQCL